MIVRLLKDGVPDATVGVPLVPVSTIVEVPAVKVPAVFVNNVPLVPVKLIVEDPAVNVDPALFNTIAPALKVLLAVSREPEEVRVIVPVATVVPPNVFVPALYTYIL